MVDVTAGGIRFHVQRLGSPTGLPPVVFIHGLVMDNLSSWFFTVANRVAQHTEVILYDLRGHGRSERPDSGYRVSDMVADLTNILNECGVAGPVRLVGNSFGGLLAIAFALAYPERSAGLFLVDAHLSDEGFGAEMAGTLGLEGSERDAKIAENFKSWLGRHSERKRNRLARSAEALVGGTTLVADLQSSALFSEAALAALPVPVVALYGETSDIRGRGERLANQLQRCELRILQGCTHSVLWEATDIVRDGIVDWSKAIVEGVTP
ncbi:MAG: pimeloyl-ACP methyl ester carboxylesterase [Myxococcota bacterium]|jgi:pimeloyl-ACP methyl ester carboxylesterase